MRSSLNTIRASLSALFAVLVMHIALQTAISQAAVLPAGPAAPTGIIGKPSWVTPDWAERHLYAIRSPLMKNSHTDHVVSLYFFGEHGMRQRTLIGLERVKGDDYQQYFSLLVFENQTLLGYYPDVVSFPLGVAEASVDDQGLVHFPADFAVKPQRSGDAYIPFRLNNDQFGPLCLADFACVPWQKAEKTKPRRRFRDRNVEPAQ